LFSTEEAMGIHAGYEPGIGSNLRATGGVPFHIRSTRAEKTVSEIVTYLGNPFREQTDRINAMGLVPYGDAQLLHGMVFETQRYRLHSLLGVSTLRINVGGRDNVRIVSGPAYSNTIIVRLHEWFEGQYVMHSANGITTIESVMPFYVGRTPEIDDFNKIHGNRVNTNIYIMHNDWLHSYVMYNREYAVKDADALGITVVVPEGMAVDFEINGGLPMIYVTVNGVDIGSGVVNASGAIIRIDDARANSFAINMANRWSFVEVSNTDTGNFAITAETGNVNFFNTALQNFNTNMSSGALSLYNINMGDAVVNMNSGTVNVHLASPSENYDIQFHADRALLRYQGFLVRDYDELRNEGAASRLVVNMNTGTLAIQH